MAYINLLVEGRVSVKEAQELARQASPELTMNVYGRARQEALAAAAENIASAIEADEKCAIVCQNPTAIAAELIQVIAAWNTLSTPVREAILTIVKNITPSGR